MRKSNLPYDYLLDHSLYDLERLLKMQTYSRRKRSRQLKK